MRLYTAERAVMETLCSRHRPMSANALCQIGQGDVKDALRRLSSAGFILHNSDNTWSATAKGESALHRSA